jgi:5-methylcytosine-specific restriction protein A
MARHSHGWATHRPNTRHAYGAAHQRIRKRLLTENPYCQQCLEHGREVEAKFADHRVPVCLGGPAEPTNYQALCAPLRSDQDRQGRRDDAQR